MPAVVFVHGVTVREDRFKSLVGNVGQRLTAAHPGAAVSGSFWGDLATAPSYQGASIPGNAGRRAAVEALNLEELSEDQLRLLLLDQPLLELAVLADEKGRFSLEGAGFERVPESVVQRNAALADRRKPVVDALCGDGGLLPSKLKRASVEQAADTVLKAAAGCDERLGFPELVDPVARALTAMLYRKAEDLEVEDGFRWSEVEAATAFALDPTVRRRGWVTDQLKNIGLTAATGALRAGLRQRIMGAVGVFTGDVLTYLSRRDEILARLETDVAKAAAASPGQPLWLVGHSLGGIIAFDYCSTTQRKVQRLATVGSQVGLFGELGALRAHAPQVNGKYKTPDAIGTWINIFDLDDMLSFCAEPIFTSVLDRPVDTKAPFPVSHSEYWNRDDVYKKICEGA